MLSAAFRCLRFGYFDTQDRLERLGKLILDINIFEYGEVGALFRLLETTLFAGDDHDRNTSQSGFAFYRRNELAAAHLGHLNIGNDNVRPRSLERFECLLSVGR